MTKPSHRAVRLSRVDSERISRGELGSEAEALHEALTEETGDGPSSDEKVEARDARERQLLEDLPPHFGKI
ncbi:hypothetical protein [Ancrocorticia populi]|uniref:Uncharacterized protein n=1 Tax=Ancrocorticia populi TaxID=2175228 RepID=A0A2V1KCG3_9ACTO|nr:hypothetical protein [Ancrocorticia populi]MDN6486200.1 hypothetical protein [Ancrocorticia sp.]PWF27197.1 hypothetical protein DD236_02005 [Ancrocorticia populi]